MLALLDDLAASGEPYAVEARWEGAPGGESGARASRSRATTRRATYVDASLLADPAVHEPLLAARRHRRARR